MNFDWVPGAGLAIAGAGLVMWRQSAVRDAKFAAFEELTNLKLAALEKRLEASITIAQNSDGIMSGEVKEACKDLRAVASDFKAMAAGQAIINQVTNKALEGIVNKLEVQQVAINDHGASLRDLLGPPVKRGVTT